MAVAAQMMGPAKTQDFEPVDLGGRCEILPGSPLPDCDGAGGSAYVCRSLRDRKTEQFAIVCTADVPPRIDVLSTFRSMDHPNILRVVDWGTVFWTPDKRRRFVIVFERPGGRRLMDSLADTKEPFTEDQIARQILPALLSGVKEMQGRGLTFGAIRPTNLFFKDATSAGLLIGDSVSAPPGYSQPVLLETIERSLAQPSGRGPGVVGDDLYALGVTLILLLLGRNPTRGMEDDQIIQAKMDRGTYNVLTSGVRMPQNLIEPLRGLTTDDPKQRWTVADLDMWLQGRRLSPKQPGIAKRGARPLEFQGQELWFCRAVARAFTRNAVAAAAMVDRGELDKWLRRSLSDETRAEAVQSAVDSAGVGARASNVEERLIARVAIALDPPAPIRYRGQSVMPDGIGTALAEAMSSGRGVQPMAEMVLAQLPMFWVNCQPEFRPEHVPLVQNADYYRTLLEQTGPGFGVERILYEMNPAMQCLSPLFAAHHVLNLADMMQALDEIGANGGGRGRDPVDRHVAAFIATHNKKMNDRLLNPLAAAGDPARRSMAAIGILADVQRRFGPAHLPNLCQWLANLAEPAIKRFRNRRTRERLKTEAQRIAREGSVDALFRMLDDVEAWKKDEKGFVHAQSEHENLVRGIAKLKRGITDRTGIAHGTGRQVAAVVSSVVAMVLLLVIIFFMAGGA